MPNGIRDRHGVSVTVDKNSHYVCEGKKHYVNKKFTSVTKADGATIYVLVPLGVCIHYTATYYSTTGGILDAYLDPVLSADGTPLTAFNYNSTMPASLKSKAYATPTITANGFLFRSIGVSGGTGLAGTGSTGATEQRTELIIRPGRYLLRFTPADDSSTVIYDITVHEDVI